jgi:hypothetical protein
LDPAQWFGQNVDYGGHASRNTFVFLPALPEADGGPDLSTLNGVTAETLYVSAEGRINQGTGTFRSLNPTPIDDEGEVILYRIGTVDFGPTNPQPGEILAPSLILGTTGLQELFGTDRNTCTAVSTFQPFQPTSSSDNADAADSRTQQTFAFGQDPDGDLWATDFDVCPRRSDPGQSDNGRVATPDNPTGVGKNGHGDVCECGNVIGPEGKVLQDDADVMLQMLAGNPPPGANVDRCSTVGADPDQCGPEDWVALKQAQSTPGGKLDQACAAAFR